VWLGWFDLALAALRGTPRLRAWVVHCVPLMFLAMLVGGDTRATDRSGAQLTMNHATLWARWSAWNLELNAG